MRRVLWLAPVFAATLAAVPLLARVCEVRCAARVSHCQGHEEAPKAPGGCPETSHRTEAPSLAAGKIASVGSGAVAVPIATPVSSMAPDNSRRRPQTRAPRDVMRPDLAALRVLRL